MSLLSAFRAWWADQQRYRQLAAIKAAVDRRITYKHYAGKDYRYIPAGQKAEGNCTVFARTYQLDCIAAGLPCVTMEVKLASGEGHAYAFSGGWVLDNRYRAPVRLDDWKP